MHLLRICFYFYIFITMKLITFIVSLYFIVLSALPCVDIESGSLAHSEQGTHSHDKDNDLCSPFCICNCCGHFTLNYAPAITFEIIQVPFEQITTQNSIYTSVFHSNFYGSIWQPPQLV